MSTTFKDKPILFVKCNFSLSILLECSPLTWVNEDKCSEKCNLVLVKLHLDEVFFELVNLALHSKHQGVQRRDSKEGVLKPRELKLCTPADVAQDTGKGPHLDQAHLITD